jgi:hypothetical protein
MRLLQPDDEGRTVAKCALSVFLPCPDAQAGIIGSMSDIHEKYPIGMTFVAKMHWRLDSEQDIRASAGFLVEVILLDLDDNRFLCMLKSLEYLNTTHPPEMADPALLGVIRGLPGKYAFVPFEAAEGRTLFLKPGTLTGRNNYFLDADSEKIAKFNLP